MTTLEETVVVNSVSREARFYVLMLLAICVFVVGLFILGFLVGRNEAIDKTATKAVEQRLSTLQKVQAETDWYEFEATAYTQDDEGCSLLTKTEYMLNPLSRVVAVDPEVIPLGSTVEIHGLGVFYAEDVGGSIKGNCIDIFVWDDRERALQFGRRKVKVRVKWTPQ